ncbi:hypothetical protein O0L34_g1413 [Tuta absoluta]|nr:hypothetical protein O0L34_g1413 [Tuta absoluta]
MSVENPVAEQDGDSGKVNGSKNEHVNGVHNGYSSSSDKHKSSHKSSSKDKHRDKDRDHKSSKHSSSSSRDKDKHSSSKSHSSSHKSSSKDKDRSDKDKDRSDKDKDRSDKDKDRKDRDREKDKHRSDKDKHRDKDKERSDKDKERSDKDKSRSDRDKEKHKSSDERKSSSSSKDKDKDRDKNREHKSSSSSKDKDRKDRDKEKDRDKDRHRSDKDKDKHRSDRDKHSSSKHSSSSSIKKEKEEESKVKIEEVDPLSDPNIKDEPMQIDEPVQEIKKEDSEDGFGGMNTTASSCDYSLSQFKDEPLADLPDDSEEDIPLLARKRKSKSQPSDSEEDVPILKRKKSKKKIKKEESDFEAEEEEEEEPKKKKKKKEKPKPAAKPVKQIKSEKSIKMETNASPTKRKGKKQEEEQEVWKWWEEKKEDDGTKWKFLEHKGPVFAPAYEPLPQDVKFRYDGKVVRLSQDAEEVAGFYARMLEHDYTTKPVFNNNFFADWRKVMTHEETKLIKDLSKCDFKEMAAYFASVSEKNKNRTKEEKAEIKAKNEEITKEYGFCIIDGHKEKIGNFRIEPPGLFRGRGEHPKMGMLKRRVMPEDVLINCSKDSKIPKAPPGHKWKEVRHDNTVTWLASWTENVQGQSKYVMLNPSSKLKGEKDWQKYETARKLHKCIDKIRDTYRQDWKAKEMRVRQRAVALYFIDRLALRAGNEKDDDQADTVGCCSLRVEHIDLHKEKDGKEYVVVFDFLGKDSIRYYNEVPVEKRVFKNLELFMENKKDNDDLFDRLNTQTLNEHLKELMPGLTAKVFRTYNASITLQRQLDELTDEDASVPEKILAYNRANRAVAVLCNHQRAVPKGHSKSMEALKEKIQAKRDALDEAEAELADARKQAKRGSVKEKMNADKKAKALERLRDQLKKLELEETNRDENKTIALGTSKLNYLDPRISVAWCKKHGVPIEKIYNKTQRDKFRWAIDMAGPEYVF